LGDEEKINLMKKVLLTLILLLSIVLVKGQNCPPAPLCGVTAFIPQDSCPPSMYLAAYDAPTYVRICASNVPSAVADTMGVTASVYTPANIQNPMTSISVYFSLDTIPGMDSYACGADISAWLETPAGTFLQLTSVRPFNDGSIPNHYKPTFSHSGTDGIIPLLNGSYDLCNYMPEGGLLEFAGENPYAGGGQWKLWVYDENGAGGCTDTARITEFCITFGTYPPNSNYIYSWTADSSNWLSYLSDTTIQFPLFNPPPGYYDITYYVTLTDTVSGCTATDTLNIHCPNPSSVSELNGTENEFYVTVINSEITFIYPSTSAKKEIIIYSIHGKEIARYALPQWSSTQKIKLPQMAGGVYEARMVGEGGELVANVKFVISQ
jgi:hypothetical protein